MRCSVCGKWFKIFRTVTYQVRDDPHGLAVLTNASTLKDAIDCPRCGCQHLLKVRVPKVNGGDRND